MFDSIEFNWYAPSDVYVYECISIINVELGSSMQYSFFHLRSIFFGILAILYPGYLLMGSLIPRFGL